MTTELQILLVPAAIVCAAMFGWRAGWRARDEWGRWFRRKGDGYNSGPTTPKPDITPKPQGSRREQLAWRRPILKEQALRLLETYNTSGVMLTADQATTIRRALEALND
jgi:hypothetical protein